MDKTIIDFTDKQSSEIKETFKKNMAEFEAKHLSRPHETFIKLGKVMHYNSMVEDLLLEYIKTENPNIGPVEKVIWSFKSKLTLAINMRNGKILEPFEKPLLALNDIRNAYGHDLDTKDCPKEQIKTLKDFLKDFLKDRIKVNEAEDIKVVEVFVGVFAMVMKLYRSLNQLKEKSEKEYQAFLESVFTNAFKE